MSFAKQTTVTIEKTQGAIRKVLNSHSATGFAFAENGGKAMIMFELGGKRIKFTLPLPSSVDLSTKKWEQLHRTRWRCLLLAIKAKLECVESKITTLEQEFMAHIMLPNGSTVGETMLPQIEKTYTSGKMPPMLGYDGSSK